MCLRDYSTGIKDFALIQDIKDVLSELFGHVGITLITYGLLTFYEAESGGTEEISIQPRFHILTLRRLRKIINKYGIRDLAARKSALLEYSSKTKIFN